MFVTDAPWADALRNTVYRLRIAGRPLDAA